MSKNSELNKSHNKMGPIPRDPRADNDPQEDEVDGEVEMQMGLLGQGEQSSDDSWSDEDIDPDHEDIDWYETGYQLLPQDADNQQEPGVIPTGNSGAIGATNQQTNQPLQSSSSSHTQPNLPPYLSKVLPTQKPEPFHDDAFNQYSTSSESVERRKSPMAADDQIKNAMAAISLPSSAVPQWAEFVTEDDWKTQLVSALNTRQQKPPPKK
ncbi:uncharacterized protein LOC144444622 [Glandiceps talaboti]